MFNKVADETKELVKTTFGFKSNKSALLNNTSKMISVKAPEPVEIQPAEFEKIKNTFDQPKNETKNLE